MRARFLREVAKAGLPSGPGPAEPVTAAELAGLPAAARRYLGFMGIAGRPRDWSFRAGLDGRFRTKPDRHLRPCTVWQYTSRLAVARFFHIRMRYGGIVPLVGRDLYRAGEGHVSLRLLDLVTIENGRGAEYDANALVGYLNDAVLIAPSMLLVPEITWSAVDGESFDVAISHRGRSVSARVMIDERGAPADFSTMDRSCYDPEERGSLVRTRWTTQVTGWEMIAGRRLPTRTEATWHLPQGRFAYSELRVVPETIAFNVAPGA